MHFTPHANRKAQLRMPMEHQGLKGHPRIFEKMWPKRLTTIDVVRTVQATAKEHLSFQYFDFIYFITLFDLIDHILTSDDFSKDSMFHIEP